MDGTPDDGTSYLPALAGFRAVFDASTEPTMVIDADDRIRVANAAACDLLGYAAADLLGRTFDVLVAAGQVAQVNELRQAWAASTGPGALGSAMDLRALRADGTEVPVEVQLRR